MRPSARRAHYNGHVCAAAIESINQNLIPARVRTQGHGKKETSERQSANDTYELAVAPARTRRAWSTWSQEQRQAPSEATKERSARWRGGRCTVQNGNTGRRPGIRTRYDKNEISDKRGKRSDRTNMVPIAIAPHSGEAKPILSSIDMHPTESTYFDWRTITVERIKWRSERR
jgi:hypothetical protein